MAMALLLGLLTAQSPPQAPTPPVSQAVTVVDSAEMRLVGQLGNCVTRDGRPIDMARVGFLEARPLVFDAPGGPYTARVDGQTLLVDDPAHGTYFNRIDYQVAEDGGGNLDLQIQLAIVEGRVALYWRETYRNRIYHQGFYTITGKGVAYLCAGRGGMRVED